MHACGFTARVVFLILRFPYRLFPHQRPQQSGQHQKQTDSVIAATTPIMIASRTLVADAITSWLWSDRAHRDREGEPIVGSRRLRGA